MKAVTIADYGGVENLDYTDVETPKPGPGECLIRLEYSGVNFHDVYVREGFYKNSTTYPNKPPFVIGVEGAGAVAEVGSGVDGFQLGDTVAYCLIKGSYAEYAVVPADKLVKAPEDMPLEAVTGLMLQGQTAHYLTHSLYALQPGDSCLVHAGAGGVGQYLIQLAKIRGAVVLATVGSPEKAEVAKKRGADHVILYRNEDFQQVVMERTGGEGVNVVYDSVGKDTISRSIRSLKRRGVCANFGNASGGVGGIDPLELAEAGSVFFTRPHMADYMATPEERAWRATDLFSAYRENKLTVPIDHVFPLADAGEAHRTMEARKTTGKLLLRTAD
jgi:NADPH2:quinone reductase